jgi:hypothetical protein
VPPPVSFDVLKDSRLIKLMLAHDKNFTHFLAIPPKMADFIFPFFPVSYQTDHVIRLFIFTKLGWGMSA